MIAISYKMKYLNKFLYSSKKTVEVINFSEYVLRLQKERQLWQKLKNKLLFLGENQCRSH